jgi:hypothetical protein
MSNPDRPIGGDLRRAFARRQDARWLYIGPDPARADRTRRYGVGGTIRAQTARMHAERWTRSPNHLDLLESTRVADCLSGRPPLAADLHKHPPGVGGKGTHMGIGKSIRIQQPHQKARLGC